MYSDLSVKYFRCRSCHKYRVFFSVPADQKIAAEQEIPRIDGVTLTIGEVSGIIPEYLADCWNYFRKRYPALTEAELS